MAQLLSIRLVRGDSSTSWGFRLQGGKDFGTPLLIQKVNVGSLAEKAGLQVGDAVIRVNGKEVSDIRHKDAQDTIVRAGNNFEITLQRGGTTTWKPAVIPIGSVPSPNPYKSTSPSPVTKTSLTATNRQSPRIPAGFNSSSKPFSPQSNGGYVNENGSIKAIVNKQYNTPVGIYSDESIAETLSAQAEVLAGGVLGVNFKKNEKNYNSESSEVFKMVLEAEKEPKSPEPDASNGTISPPVSGLRHVSAPQNKTPSSPQTTLAPGQNICADCERLIVGVFVRIKDKNLHVECFKCATCGTSLKNVGYYTINNKLYCDIHAKMVARQNPPAPNLEPITISPSATGASKIISSALSNSTSAPLSPQPALAPVPFHPPRHSPTHVSPPQPQNFSTLNGTKSFSPTNNLSSSVSAPKPDSSAKNVKHDLQHISYYNPSQKRLPFLKPRNEKTSAFMPIMKTSIQSKGGGVEQEMDKKDLKLETVFENLDQKEEDPGLKPLDVFLQKRLSICSQEVSNVLSETIISRQSPLVVVNNDRPESPVPSESADEFLQFEQFNIETCKTKNLHHIIARPHSVRSISPCERPLTPSQVVVFPPEMPITVIKSKLHSPVPIYSKSKLSRESTPINETNKNIDSEMIPVKRESSEISLKDLPVLPLAFGGIGSMLSTASDRPFTPIEPAKATIFNEPVPLPPETQVYLPSKEEEQRHLPDFEKTVSPLVFALITATDRPYSPLPTTPKFDDLFVEKEEPKQEVKKRPSMADALTTISSQVHASHLNYNNSQKSEEKEKDIVPDLSTDPSIILTNPIMPSTPKPTEKITKPTYVCSSSFYIGEAAFPPITEELKAKFEKRLRTGSISEKSIHKTPKNEESISAIRMTPTNVRKTPKIDEFLRMTPTGLHKPDTLPHYQKCVKELVSRNKSPSQSRKNTPTPNKIGLSRKSTPTSFEATVSTQQKIFLPESRSCGSVIKTATSFLTETKDISEKIPPVLGYQPCSIVDNLSSFTKVEECVKTVCERTLKQIQLEQSKASCEISQFSSKSCEQKIITSRCSTPVQNIASAGLKPPSKCSSPVLKPPSRGSTPIQKPISRCSSPKISSSTADVSTQQKFIDSNSSSKTLTTTQITRNLSKTLAALTSNISSKNPSTSNTNTSSDPNLTGSTIGGGMKGGRSADFSAPRRGKGVWNPQNVSPGARIPLCAQCSSQIRGPFITALGKIWCPDHFVCANQTCKRSLMDIGFVEEPTGLYCEYCFEQFLAPTCGKCSCKIKGDCLNAIGKHFHPECFVCAYCAKKFGNSPFFLEEGLPYCENDWNELFTTKCFACGFPIEAGDRWVEALNNNYHSPCFNCTMCKTNLEGQSFYAKGGRPFCKTHAR